MHRQGQRQWPWLRFSALIILVLQILPVAGQAAVDSEAGPVQQWLDKIIPPKPRTPSVSDIWPVDGSQTMPVSSLPRPDHLPFPVFNRDPAPFLKAIADVSHIVPVTENVTGITVPHHLLAARLAAAEMARLRGRKYTRIILLSPDHFRRNTNSFCVPDRDFLTWLGKVPLDGPGASALLRNPLVSVSSLFSHEHGVQVLLPFIAWYFTDTPVLPVSFRVDVDRGQCDSLAQTLAPLLGPDTLLVQSTDFSHFMNWSEAQKKDQESLQVIGSDDPVAVWTLEQPRHLDCKGAQYVQMKLQKELYNASPTVTANHNSLEFVESDYASARETTSYITQIYAHQKLFLPGENKALVFGGDFFTGRYMRKHLEDGEKHEFLVKYVHNLTQRAAFIVNFEGVLMDDCPEEERSTAHQFPPKLCMPVNLTLDLMREFGIVAVSQANNHSFDFGEDVFSKTESLLEQAGITTLQHNKLKLLNGISIAAFTDIDNNQPEGANLLRKNDFDTLAGYADDRLLAVYVHCGKEFSPEPGARVQLLAEKFHASGARLFIAAHPHCEGRFQWTPSGADAWSLGNFLFDQSRPESGGALLDLVIFPQGTYWLQLRSIGNLYRKLTGSDDSAVGTRLHKQP
jgi:poly-gamma-glutamate synthesis protein (capsule biosynthesis protein)